MSLAQKSIGQSPVPFLALQVAETGQKHVERLRLMHCRIDEGIDDRLDTRLSFDDFDVCAGSIGRKASAAKQAGTARRCSAARCW